MTQTPAPIEFKNNSKINDTTKYYVPEEENVITSDTIKNIPTEAPTTGYLVEETQETQTQHKSSTFPEENNSPAQTQSTTPLNDQKKEDKPIANNVDEELEAELGSILEPKKQSSAAQNPKTVKEAAIQPNTDTVKQPNTSKYGFINPVNGNIIKSFNSQHQGISIAANLGEPIKAIQDGQVVYSGYDNKFGNLVIIKLKHDDLFAAFAYMEDLIVTKGTQVTQGQTIGHVGQSGSAEDPQLYFALKKGKTAMDPIAYFNY